MDGVFAVMTTVYECFLGYAEPERMIPGHRDTLGKALAVRRALAVLRREVQELNRSIQDSLDSIGPDYRGQHRYFNDGPVLPSLAGVLIVAGIGSFVANRWAAWRR